MTKSTKGTNLNAPFLPKEISDEDLLARYADYQASNPVCPKITNNANSTATIVTSYFEDADPKEFATVLEHEKVPEIEIEPEDPDAFNLYSPNRSRDEIEWDDSAKEELKPASTAVKEKLTGPANRRNKRLKALISTKDYLLTTAEQVINEQVSLAAAIAASANPAEDKNLTRRTIVAELRLYGLGINTRKWAHKQQVLEEEIEFAETAAGKDADEKAEVEWKAARVLKEKEKKERKKAKKAVDEKRLKGKSKGRSSSNRSGSKEPLKLGRHAVGEKVSRKEKSKLGGPDLNRVNKSGGSKRGGKGGRAGSRQRRGGSHDGRKGRGEEGEVGVGGGSSNT